MTQFTPDPDRLRRLMQAALGDRQIDNVPGYDPAQVLPVVVINASEFPTTPPTAEWTPWLALEGAAGTVRDWDWPNLPNNGELWEVWPFSAGATLGFDLLAGIGAGNSALQLYPFNNSDGPITLSSGGTFLWLVNNMPPNAEVVGLRDRSGASIGCFVRRWVGPA